MSILTKFALFPLLEVRTDGFQYISGINLIEIIKVAVVAAFAVIAWKIASKIIKTVAIAGILLIIVTYFLR